jgi:hypothetical protein
MSLEENLLKQIAFLEGKLSFYENDGVGKLYHALNRKANEMAELLNRTSLLVIDIDDPKVKTFDRLQKIWSDAESISSAIKALGVLAGVNNPEAQAREDKEKKEPIVINKPFSPEMVADQVGELAGKKQ